MTQEQLLEAVRSFFKQATRLDARYVRPTLERTDAHYRTATISLRYGAREFRVEIDRCRNTIRLSEIAVRRRFGLDSCNPLNGFTMREVEHVRLLHTHRLDRYLLSKNNLDKNE
jgi:hypothetical protein|nr:MAG TPA: hypothetical protein [Caudoviricetes sp.]